MGKRWGAKYAPKPFQVRIQTTMDFVKTGLRFFMHTGIPQLRFDISMLIFRLFLGFFMAAGHGWGKMVNFSERADSFPDPLGVGSPVSLAMAVLAEFFASIAIALYP